MATADDYDEYDDDDTADEQPKGSPLRARLKQLEAENKQFRETSTKAARELAFVKAGIDPDSPRHRYFAKGYDGELTVDAIKAEAAEAGLIDAAPKDTVDPGERAAHERMQAANAGAHAATARDWDAEIRSAKTRDEALTLIREREAAEQQ